jgi:hypothetical protein
MSILDLSHNEMLRLNHVQAADHDKYQFSTTGIMQWHKLVDDLDNEYIDDVCEKDFTHTGVERYERMGLLH